MDDKYNKSLSPVFLVGTLFCGSTLIGRELTARLTNTHYIGESINFLEYDKLYHPHPRGKKWLCVECGKEVHGGSRRECIFFDEKQRNNSSFNNIQKFIDDASLAFSKDNIIDGSKYVAWLQLYLSQGNYDTKPKVIITLRSPFAFADSYRKRNNCTLYEAASIWRDTYVDALRTVNSHSLNCLTIRYEDFMDNMDDAVKELSKFLSNTKIRKNTDYTQCHSIGGNPNSLAYILGSGELEKFINEQDKLNQATELNDFVKNSKQYWSNDLKKDTKWYSGIRSEEISQIIQTPGLVDLANLFGYNLYDELKLFINENTIQQENTEA